MASSSPPLVTIFITTENKADYIGRCLDSIHAMNYKNLEILVVDSHSTDSTVEIARQKGARVILLSRASIPLAYNTVMKESKGDYVFVVNGDSLVDENFLGNAVAEFESNPKLGMVLGRRKQFSTQTFFSKLYEARFFRNDQLGYIDNPGGNFLLRKSAYLEVIKELDERLVAYEERYIGAKFVQNGYKNFRIKDYSMIHLDIAGSVFKYIKKHAWYSDGKAFFVLKSWKLDGDFILCFLLYFGLFMIFLNVLPVSVVPLLLMVIFGVPVIIVFVSGILSSFDIFTSLVLGMVESLATFLRMAFLPYYLLINVFK